MHSFPKIPLGLFPTPIYHLPNMSKALGVDVWIKRDDMTGVLLGGNKVRKLEYLLADAKQSGYDLVMTTGQAQSNHATLTAACALRAGMDCVLVLKKRGVTDCKGNQILNHLMGVRVVFMDVESYDDIYAEMDRIGDEMGRKVYKIPCGGSNALGTLGYVDCMKEIAACGQHFDHIVCACGSGGTTAGTMLGAGLYLPGTGVTGVMVDDSPFDQIVPELVRQGAELMDIDKDAALPALDLMDMAGPGYSISSEAGNEAIAMMMRLEGIVLDPCYTGKAFAGLIKRCREGYYKPKDRVLFLHTGGAGGLFARDGKAFESDMPNGARSK